MSIDRDQARERAREILSGGRFRRVRIESRPQHPSWFERNVGAPIGRFISAFFRVFGGFIVSLPGLLLAVAAVIALCVWVAARVAKSRSDDTERSEASLGDLDRVSPDQLDRDAADAEGRGDFGPAVRLRFRAGLTRLQRAGVIEDRTSITAAQVGRKLRSANFDGVSRTFDSVAYGGIAAEANDAAKARDTWPVIVDEATR